MINKIVLINYRKWVFRVTCKLKPDEEVFVVGSSPEIGEWDSQRQLALQKESDDIDDEETIWSTGVYLPKTEIQYRYCICTSVKLENENILRYAVLRWETSLLPRVIPVDVTNSEDNCCEIFGCHGDMKKVDMGWLEYDSLIQLRLTPSDIYQDPIVLWNKQLKNKNLFVKVSPIDMSNNENACIEPALDESTDLDLTEFRQQANVQWPKIEVAVMKEGYSRYTPQDQFGILCSREDMIVFQCRAINPFTITFLVDLYIETSTKNSPKHLGCSYILPASMKENFGVVNVPITSKKQVAIGQLTAHYLVVHPMENFKCDMQISYARYWKASWKGLEVGHRGAGNSFHSQTKSCANIRENTIASLLFAVENGADMVEFDVQLSKDLIPVIYHDFYAYIALKGKKESSESDLLKIPVKDLTLNQLQALKIFHESEQNGYSRFTDDEYEEHQPFPTLEKAMGVVPDSCAFNIELKWTMRHHDGSYQLEHPFELNRFLDIILKIVLSSTTKRKIVFSCFHPDICTMIRLKQNKYPVLFLIKPSSDEIHYDDIRTRNFDRAVYYCASANLLGINVESKIILEAPKQVQLAFNKKLIVFCWGENNNDSSTISFLKKLGLHGIIYDRIDIYNTKEKKESIFLCNDERAQNCIFACQKSIPNNSPLPQSHFKSTSNELEENCSINAPTSFQGILSNFPG